MTIRRNETRRVCCGKDIYTLLSASGLVQYYLLPVQYYVQQYYNYFY